MSKIQTKEDLDKRLLELEKFYEYIDEHKQFRDVKIENFDGEILFHKLEEGKRWTEDHEIIKFFRERKNASYGELNKLIPQPIQLSLSNFPGIKGKSECFKIGFDMLNVIMVSGGEWTQEEYIKEAHYRARAHADQNPDNMLNLMNSGTPWYKMNCESDAIISSKNNHAHYAQYNILLGVKPSSKSIKNKKAETELEFNKTWNWTARIELNISKGTAEAYRFSQQYIDGSDPNTKKWIEGE